MAGSELGICVLWHMHQPDYVDGLTNRAKMPWVRLHALLSYYDMVRVLQEVPGARANFNVVPILMRQLEDNAAGRIDDDFLALARPSPADLSAEDRIQLLRHFFAFNHKRRFSELSRLAELWQRRAALGETLDSKHAAAFSDQDLRDLQVGFHLAWSGRTLREHELVTALFRKGRDFSEAEKGELLALQHEFLGKVLPAYAEAAASGQLELSCTPYYHPILPLLCDTDAARQAVPEVRLPEQRFRWPGDAWCQVQSALSETERILGVRPSGMWPAEGSISEDAIQVFTSAGIRWLGSDQDVLTASWRGRSLPPGGHFRPYRWGGPQSPALFFRDKGLSDRIGFVYAAWSPQAAASDLIGILQGIRTELPAGRFLVPIMLDGENPWESYPDSGTTFLQEFYRGVVAAEGLRWTTLAEYLDATPPAEVMPLEQVVGGSWIRHDFTTWIGHPEKNAGWNRLGTVRRWLEERLERAGALRQITLPGSAQPVSAPDPDQLGPRSDSTLARAWQAMAAAEGSDWFWWYGEEHPTEFAVEFDALFRQHLMNVYSELGSEPDPVLQVSLLMPKAEGGVRPPRFPLRVTLDGKVSSYYEWLDAGSYELTGGQAMHRATAPIARIYFGASCEHVYVRLDPNPGDGLEPLAQLEIAVHRLDGQVEPVRLRFPPAGPGGGRLVPAGPAASRRPEQGEGVCADIVEIRIPRQRLGFLPGQHCEFFVTLARGDKTELVAPAAGCFALRMPVGPDDADDWLV